VDAKECCVLIDSGAAKNLAPFHMLVNVTPLRADDTQTVVYGNGTQETIVAKGYIMMYLEECNSAQCQPIIVEAWASTDVPFAIISATNLAAAGVEIKFSRDGHYADFSALGGPLKALCSQSRMKAWIMAADRRPTTIAALATVPSPPVAAPSAPATAQGN
jgi:hypothetical protein